MGRKLKEEAKQKPFRKKDKMGMSHKTIFVMIASLVLLGMVFVFFYRHGNTTAASNVAVNPDTLPGVQLGEAPWQPELNHLRERLNRIGLPALSQEGTALHTHQHIDIFVNGKSVPVPASIGIHRQERFISPIHTHDATSVIHIESPTVQAFTLGQFLDIWGVRFTPKCIGSYCEDEKNSIQVFVNGQATAGDPRPIELADHQEIVITYGMSNELPNPIPSQYQFAPGS